MDLTLAQALQRAFTEAGEPSVSSVAAATGASRQRLSDWRSGRHVPSRFEDLAPVIGYLTVAAGPQSGSGSRGGDGGRVTGWPVTRWQQAWHQSVRAADPQNTAPHNTEGARPDGTDTARLDGTDSPRLGGTGEVPGERDDTRRGPGAGAGSGSGRGEVDRRRIALAVMTLLVGLVAALAVAGFLLSWTTL